MKTKVFVTDTLAALITNHMLVRHLSEEWVARKAKVSRGTVRNIKSGQHNPHQAATVAHICEVVGVTEEEMDAALKDDKIETPPPQFDPPKSPN